MATSTNTNEKANDSGFKGFNIPNIDTSAMIDSYKKNLEVLGLINKMSAEVCNGITKLQTAFIKQMMSDMGGVAEKGAKPSEIMAKFSDVTRDTIVKAMKNNKEISDMITVANNEITAATAKRFKESMEEAKSTVNKKH